MNFREYLDYVGEEKAKGWLLRGNAERDGIFVPRVFLRICKSNPFDGIILSQIMYWADVDKERQPRMQHRRNGHLWIVKTHKEWAAEVELEVSTIGGCLRRLASKTFIIMERHKSPFHQMQVVSFVRPNWPVMMAAISGNELNSNPEREANSQPENQLDQHPEVEANSQPESEPNSNSFFTETTAEIPTENTANSTSNEKRVTAVLAKLADAKIKFSKTDYPNKPMLIKGVIEEHGYKTVMMAVQDAERESAKWWSYVEAKLEAQKQHVMTGEDYISGKYADYIDH